MQLTFSWKYPQSFEYCLTKEYRTFHSHPLPQRERTMAVLNCVYAVEKSTYTMSNIKDVRHQEIK